MDIITLFRRTARRNADRVFRLGLSDDSHLRTGQGRATTRLLPRSHPQVSPEGEPLGLCAPDSVELLLVIIGAWKANALPALDRPENARGRALLLRRRRRTPSSPPARRSFPTASALRVPVS